MRLQFARQKHSSNRIRVHTEGCESSCVMLRAVLVDLVFDHLWRVGHKDGRGSNAGTHLSIITLQGREELRLDEGWLAEPKAFCMLPCQSEVHILHCTNIISCGTPLAASHKFVNCIMVQDVKLNSYNCTTLVQPLFPWGVQSSSMLLCGRDAK
jgi:hypothetical protein